LVRTRRDSKDFFGLCELNDGSSLRNLQVIARNALPNYLPTFNRLTHRRFKSSCMESSSRRRAKGQKWELVAGQDRYRRCSGMILSAPEKKGTRRNFARDRSPAAALQIFSAQSFRGSQAGIAFAITNFFQEPVSLRSHTHHHRAAIAEARRRTVSRFNHRSQEPPRKDSEIDYAEGFFARPNLLTVKRQLEAEAFALRVSKVYTFGPTFRAEKLQPLRGHRQRIW